MSSSHFNAIRLAALMPLAFVGWQSATADDSQFSRLVQTTAVEFSVSQSQDAVALASNNVAALSQEGEAAPAVIPQPSPSDEVAAPQVVESPVVSPAPVSSAPCNCNGACCCTKKRKEAATAAMKGAFKGVFYANDFSYLNDPCYSGDPLFGECLKGLHCGAVDVGGEARVRYHREQNMRGLGLTGRSDEFWLTRYRMYANVQLTENVRWYGEWLYADSGAEQFNPRPIEENREMQNMFVDVQLTDSFNLRGGRQEILLGNQRLISPLDWANTRRTFDGLRGTYKGDTWTIDSFFLNPMRLDVKGIDSTNRDVQFWGIYGARGETAIGNLEAYYLGLNNDAADFDYQTIGGRVYGTGAHGNLYEVEGGVQFGENAPSIGGNRTAGFFTGGIGRKLSLCTRCGEWTPTVWMWYDWASGGEDFPANRGDDSFDHLFPLAHKYLGFMDLFGRRNINDVNFQFITNIGPRFKALLWYHYFFLDQATTPYGVTLQPYNTISPAASKDLGSELDLMFTCILNPRTTVVLGYSHFNAGDYYKDTPDVAFRGDADFFWTQMQMRF